MLTSTVGGNTRCRHRTSLQEPSRPYVRVVVCVRLDDVAPDVMRVLGFSIAGAENVVRQETIMRYERTR